jgi:hypothetical protein
MFTKITTALVIILGVTSGALAATAHQQHYANPASAYGAAFGARATTTQRQHSPNPAWDVYDNGHYVGSDPDPNVRMQLRVDPNGGEE